MSALTESLFGDDVEELGAAFLDWDTAVGGANLGLGDFDSVTIRMVGSKVDLVGSQNGTTPKNAVYTGTECVVEAGLGQMTPERAAA